MSYDPLSDLDRPRRPSRLPLLFVGIAAFTAFGWFLGRSEISDLSPTPAPQAAAAPDSHEAVDAWVICQQHVEERLKSPSTADFPAGYSQYTSHLRDGRYRVHAYVDAENSFGATIRNQFDCTVRWISGDTYRLESLEVL